MVAAAMRPMRYRAGRGHFVLSFKQPARHRHRYCDHAGRCASACFCRLASGLGQAVAELQDKTESLAISHETSNRNTRAQLHQLFDTLRELMTPPEPKKRPIGFITLKEAPKPKPKAVKAEKPVCKRKRVPKFLEFKAIFDCTMGDLIL